LNPHRVTPTGFSVGEPLLCGCFRPDLLPGFEFGRSYLVARIIPFVQAEQFVLGHFPEPLAVGRCHVVLDPFSDVTRCCPPVHARAYDLTDKVAQRRTVLQPERIQQGGGSGLAP
jgi:hypothetical protein